MTNERPSKLNLAWTVGRLAGRRVLGRTVSDADLRIADHLTDQLDAMKGLAMKIGQIVSYMDVPLPEQVQDTMSRLQTGNSAMGPDEIRDVIRSSIGDVPERLFEDFDFEPIAAASIGQVHRAQWKSRPVAVKVQYPDVAASFSRDLRVVDRFASLASFASSVDGKAVVRELALRLTEECDYAREARWQSRFANAFSRDLSVTIPAVVSERSSSSVLTTEWMDGDDFETFRATASKEHRQRAAETLVRFSYRSLLELGTIQADPHPGNFLFHKDGSVVFLDFGCVRSLPAGFVESLRALIASMRHGDRRAFREAVFAMGLVGHADKFDYAHFFVVMEHLHRPLLSPRFAFTPEYVRAGFELNGPTNPNARTMAMPPAYIWVARLQWGLWSILSRLGAEGEFRPILDDILARPVAASSFESDASEPSPSASKAVA